MHGIPWEVAWIILLKQRRQWPLNSAMQSASSAELMCLTLSGAVSTTVKMKISESVSSVVATLLVITLNRKQHLTLLICVYMKRLYCRFSRLFLKMTRR